MVDFIQHAMPFHVAQELDTMEGDEEERKMKILRAFLMADIHARKVGIISSGAAVAICLVQVSVGCNNIDRLNLGAAEAILTIVPNASYPSLLHSGPLSCPVDSVSSPPMLETPVW